VELNRGRTFERAFERRLLQIIAVSISLVALLYILDIPTYFDVIFYREQFFGLIYGLVFAGAFIMFPAGKRVAQTKVPIYDYVLALAGLTVGGYLFVAWPQIVIMPGITTPPKVILGGITVVLILEMTRRIFGWPLVILAGLFILYAKFNFLLPGMLGGRGTSWPRLFTFTYVDSNSILGLIAVVVFGMVFAFILFGRTLFATGGADFFTDLSLSLMGKRRGGPAKVAVIASSLFGTLSGSASSNVVITGSITIPMMKQTGYRPALAAAVESVASSGGGLMPPIMGATAFLMAEFLAVPYRDVVLAALIPAILYYVSLFIQVDLEAAKIGLKGMAVRALPPLRRVLLGGWVFILPLAVLIYCLFIIFMSPARSALIAIAALAIVSAFSAKNRLTPRRLLAILEDTGRLIVEIGVIGAVAGVIVGIVGLTSMGLVFSQLLLAISGGDIYLLMLLTAASSIILGMSMPVTASYVILAVLAAPALVEAGVSEMAAHLFIFYFAILSFITPPVCVAVYIASTIAGSKPMETAMHAMKLGMVAYIVPFVFVTNDALLMKGGLGEVALAFSSSVLGFVALAVAMQGYLIGKVGPIERVLLAAAGVLALLNLTALKLAGMAVILLAFVWLWRFAKRPVSDAAV
jgi:TRAP transporter 4TM/12TM fusion protein